MGLEKGLVGRSSFQRNNNGFGSSIFVALLHLFKLPPAFSFALRLNNHRILRRLIEVAGAPVGFRGNGHQSDTRAKLFARSMRK